MSEVLEKYELSVWKDVVPSNGKDALYFDEEKIAVIGASNWDSQIRAYDVTLVENINGDKTLSFNILRKYRNDKGELVDNPFITILTNERKLKLRIGDSYNFYNEKGVYDSSIAIQEDKEDRWMDFLIKTVDENKKSYVNTYTCKEAYVTELGKNGYATILKSELENNYGTLNELAERILEHSGWTVGSKYIPKEYSKEILFVPNQSGAETKVEITQMTTKKAIKRNQLEFYTFYSELEIDGNNWVLKSKHPQIYYKPGGFSTADADDERVVIDENDEYNYIVTGNNLSENLTWTPLNTGILGRKIVESLNTHYEPVADKYVTNYTVKTAVTNADKGSTIYGYNTTEYLSSESVFNLVTNSTDFYSSTGWLSYESDTSEEQHKDIIVYPDVAKTYAKNCLVVKTCATETTRLWNTGLIDQASITRANGETFRIVEGNKYIIRLRARRVNFTKNLSKPADSVDLQGPRSSTKFYVGIRDYNELSKGNNGWISGLYKEVIFPNINNSTTNNYVNYGFPIPIKKENRPLTTNTWNVDESGYIYCIFTAKQSIKPSASRKIGVSFGLTANKNTNYHWLVEDIQFFDYKEQTFNNKVIPVFPGDLPEATISTTSHYYKVVGGTRVDLPNKPSAYEAQKRPNYASVRHLEIEKSNYFNNINSLAELFECWVGYRVAHQKDGRLFKVNGIPKKQVLFSRFSPFDQENWAGFKYGINVDDIKRNTVSDAISTKIIVPDNVNEFAENGFCTITRAIDNNSKEKVLFNFDYYVNQGLLNQSQVTYDLYNSKKGYEAQLGKINKKLIPINNKMLTKIRDAKLKEQTYEEYSSALISLAELIEDDKIYLEGLTKNTEAYKNAEKRLKVERSRRDGLQKKADDALKAANTLYKQIYGSEDKNITYQGFWNSANSYSKGSYVRIENNIYLAKKTNMNKKPPNTTYWESAITVDNFLKNTSLYNQSLAYLDNKKLIDEAFYKKYSRFIQEGTWSDNSYIDDNAYYLDARKVLAQSAYPKVTYTISVIDISGIKKYAGYTFKVGQRTYLEDTDFFGWVYKDEKGVDDLGTWKTPFKKEVIISERTRNFDDASKSKITVQTYRNQWKDLFSKLTATTQTLAFNSGGYQRAANLVDETGQLKVDKVLEALNKINTSNTKVAEIVTPQKVVANSGVSLDMGIPVSSLTGQIDADVVNITSKSGEYTFTWDASGLNAYLKNASEQNYGQDGEVFVRYNNLGIFGTSKGEEIDNLLAQSEGLDELQRIEKIKDLTTFFLTWDGLYLNSDDGKLKLDPRRGLEIYSMNKWSKSVLNTYDYVYDGLGNKYTVKDNIPLITLGRLGGTSNEIGSDYGLRLRNDEGYITMETDNRGNLNLRNQLRVGEYDNAKEYSRKISKIIEVKKTRENVNNLDGSYDIYNVYTFLLKDKPDDNTVIYVYGINNDIVVDFNTGANGTGLSNGWTYANVNNTYQYTTRRKLNRTTGEEVNPLHLDSGYYLANYQYTNIITPFVGINGDWIGPNPIVMYAGYAPPRYSNRSSDYEPAPFKVYADGTLVAQQANITGTINATDGIFSGAVKIGNTAGINGSADAAWVFYAGDGTATEPTFYVTPDGEMVANNSHIKGDSVIEGTIFANEGRINRVYLNNSAEKKTAYWSYIGANTTTAGRDGDGDKVYINIHAGDFAVDARGYTYAEKLFLDRNDVWYNSMYPGNDGIPDLQDGAGTYGNAYNIIVGPYTRYGEDNSSVNYIFTAFNSSYVPLGDDNTFKEQSREIVFGVQDNGTVEMSGTLFANGLDLTGALRVHGVDGNNRIVIDGNNGRIYANNSFGDVWWIDKDGSAEFNNIKARGQIATSIFEYDKISAVGGNIAITPSAYLIEECPSIIELNFTVEGQEELISYHGFETPATSLDLWHNEDDVLVSILLENEETQEVYIHGQIITVHGDSSAREITKWNIVRNPTSSSPMIKEDPIAIQSIMPNVETVVLNRNYSSYVVTFDESHQFVLNYDGYEWTITGVVPLWLGNDNYSWVTPGPNVTFSSDEVDSVTKERHFSFRTILQGIIEQWNLSFRESDVNYLILHDAPSEESNIAQALNRIYHIVPEFIDGSGYTTLPKGTSLININLTHNSISLSATQSAGSTIYMTSNDGDSFKSTMIGYLDPTRISEDSIFKNILSVNNQNYYGLYSQNVFIEGRVYLPQAGVTDEDLQVVENWDGSGEVGEDFSTQGSGSEVRIWAGVGYTGMQNAPFIVTQDGSLYANKGIFKGQIKASNSEFSGHIKASGVVLGQETEEDDPDYSHFYFTWLGSNINAEQEPDINITNYIADFNRDGFNLWDSLTIFSRYYNGFYKDEQSGNWVYDYNLYSGTQYTHYGYNFKVDTNRYDFIKKGYWRSGDTPFPIFTVLDRSQIIDNNTYKIIQPRISASNMQLWAMADNAIYSSSNTSPSPIYGVNLNADHISFTKYSLPPGLIYIANDVTYTWNGETPSGTVSVDIGDQLNIYTIKISGDTPTSLVITGTDDGWVANDSYLKYENNEWTSATATDIAVTVNTLVVTNGTRVTITSTDATLSSLNIVFIYNEQYAYADSVNYDLIADALWAPSDDSDQLFSIGHMYLDAGEVIGAVSNTFTFANRNGASAMTIQNDAQNSVTIGSQTSDILNFSNQIQVEINDDGISFNYIGG